MESRKNVDIIIQILFGQYKKTENDEFCHLDENKNLRAEFSSDDLGYGFEWFVKSNKIYHFRNAT